MDTVGDYRYVEHERMDTVGDYRYVEHEIMNTVGDYRYVVQHTGSHLVSIISCSTYR
jgi:hypothetical protein